MFIGRARSARCQRRTLPLSHALSSTQVFLWCGRARLERTLALLRKRRKMRTLSTIVSGISPSGYRIPVTKMGDHQILQISSAENSIIIYLEILFHMSLTTFIEREPSRRNHLVGSGFPCDDSKFLKSERLEIRGNDSDPWPIVAVCTGIEGI